MLLQRFGQRKAYELVSCCVLIKCIYSIVLFCRDITGAIALTTLCVLCSYYYCVFFLLWVLLWVIVYVCIAYTVCNVSLTPFDRVCLVTVITDDTGLWPIRPNWRHCKCVCQFVCKVNVLCWLDLNLNLISLFAGVLSFGVCVIVSITSSWFKSLCVSPWWCASLNAGICLLQVRWLHCKLFGYTLACVSLFAKLMCCAGLTWFWIWIHCLRVFWVSVFVWLWAPPARVLRVYVFRHDDVP